jgi:hypothetical protein
MVPPAATTSSPTHRYVSLFCIAVSLLHLTDMITTLVQYLRMNCLSSCQKPAESNECSTQGVLPPTLLLSPSCSPPSPQLHMFKVVALTTYVHVCSVDVCGSTYAYYLPAYPSGECWPRLLFCVRHVGALRISKCFHAMLADEWVWRSL